VGVAPFGIAFDTRRGYLYVTNSQADTVSVIDGATNTVVRRIPLAAGPLPAGLSPMGIVYDGRNDTVYTANFGNDTISAIDAATDRLVSTIPVARAPFGLALSPRDGNLYVATFLGLTVDVNGVATNLVVES